MADPKTFLERHGVRRLLNGLGMSTLVGANVVPPEVRAAVDEAMSVNVEIDELQAAASRVIAQATGSEAGCVTSSVLIGPGGDDRRRDDRRRSREDPAASRHQRDA